MTEEDLFQALLRRMAACSESECIFILNKLDFTVPHAKKFHQICKEKFPGQKWSPIRLDSCAR